MTEQLNVQQMAQRLMTADNILILCHKNPDGDTIGCGSALYCALKALDKNVAVLCSDAIPNRYAFTNAHMFKGEFEPQTVVAVDVASVQLFGENNGMTQFSRHVDLCIDQILLVKRFNTWFAIMFDYEGCGGMTIRCVCRLRSICMGTLYKRSETSWGKQKTGNQKVSGFNW